MTQTAKSGGTSVSLNVWPVAQVTAQYQRAGRYVSDSSAHPGKMLPSLARRIVETYSEPGDLVVDPMAGIGTTVVEGAAIGRRCIGVDLEQRWADIAKQNITHVLDGDQQSLAEVRVGDARHLDEALGAASGTVDLIATSPPYACDIGSPDVKAWDAGGLLRSQASLNYSDNRANLGHARGQNYEEQMADVYAACFRALRPGGIFVTVTKNMRRRGRLVDLAGITVRLAQSVGFCYREHNIALLCAIRDGGIVGRPSFWQTQALDKAHRKGLPQHLVAHEDVLVFQRMEAANA